MQNCNLYIIDGHALAYRAFYAMINNSLRNSEGTPTSAVWGFVNYVLRILKEKDCTHIVAVFDPKGPSFRKDIYEEYKANRSAMPDDLRLQIPLIFNMLDKMNITVVTQEGLEADDIIGYFAKKMEDIGGKASIVSKDKDLMQLINKNVRMIAPETGGKFITFTPNDVEKKMGVKPSKIRDYLALMGDSSDNIPGIPKVGPKTALKILEEAGSIDAIIKDSSIIKNDKLRKKIDDNINLLKLSKTLVTLRTNLNIPFDIELFKIKPWKKRELFNFFKKMEFNSLLSLPEFDMREESKFKFNTVETLDDVINIANNAKTLNFISIDTETTSLDPIIAELVGISVAFDKHKSFYIPLGHQDGNNIEISSVIKILKDVLESDSIGKIGHNLKYDYKIFKKYGVRMRNISFDTMVAAYILDPGRRRYNLDDLASTLLNTKTIKIEELIGKKGKEQKSFADTSIEDASKYAGEDAILPLALKELMEKDLQERNLLSLLKDMELPLIPVLAEMELTGITIDTNLLSSLSKEYSEKLSTLTSEIHTLAGKEFNINSPLQLSKILFDDLALPHSRKNKAGRSTNVDALEKLSDKHPIANKILEYRELQKLLSTYIDSLPQQINPVTCRVYSSFNQTVTHTGRLSSTDPNLQNVPIRTDLGRAIRSAFIAEKGNVIISADYSQIELRILAHLSNDSRLIEAFVNDLDIHIQTASAIYGIFPEMVTEQMRRAAKSINFGLMYGMGPIKLSREINISFKEAREFIDKYFEQFPTIHTFMNNAINFAKENGYSETLFGRRRYLPEIHASNRRVAESAERMAVNTPVQGTAADIIKVTMVNISSKIDNMFSNAKMLLQVHDELVFEVNEEEAKDLKDFVVEEMSSVIKLKVPLKVEAGIGKNWNEAH